MRHSCAVRSEAASRSVERSELIRLDDTMFLVPLSPFCHQRDDRHESLPIGSKRVVNLHPPLT
jgi:hypothetical protein